MAQFVVETTPEERMIVLDILRQLEGQTVPVRVIAEQAHMRPSRVRYTIVDLMDAGKVTREATKAFNKHYVRYTYKVHDS